MFAGTIVSGVGLLLVAAVALREFWWPPLKSGSESFIADCRGFVRSCPGRWEKAKSHWRGVREERRRASMLSVLALGGVAWIYFGATPMADNNSSALGLLWIVIAFGAFAAGLFACACIGRIIAWVFEGAFPSGSSSAVPYVDPLNRVGTAAPLGEGRLATPQESHPALQGRAGAFRAPRFPD